MAKKYRHGAGGSAGGSRVPPRAAHPVPDVTDDLYRYDEAMAAFRRRSIVPRDEWDEMEAEERRRAFSVAGGLTADVVAEVWEAIDRAVRDGTDLDVFKAEVGAQLAEGWGGDDAPRLETIFRTNVMCILPGQAFSGRPVAGSQARYSGEVLQLKTESGRYLALTPNHPVLTDRGFVPAQSIRRGDHVVSHRVDIEHLTGAAQEAKQHGPTAVEDVFRALSSGGTSGVRRRLGPLDLHGDSKGIDGHVDVVRADGELLRDIQSARSDRIGQRVLKLADVPLPILYGPRARKLPFHRQREVARVLHSLVERRGLFSAFGLGQRPPVGGLGVRGAPSLNAASAQDPLGLIQGQAVIRCHRCGGHSGRVGGQHKRDDVGRYRARQPPGFGAAAQLDPVKPEATREDGAQYAEFIRQLGDRSAGQVARDQVIEVGNLYLRSHVFDFQTTTGWYTAGGIIVSNCAYNDGRYAVFSAPAVKEARPFFRFDAILDDRTDDECEELNGTVLPQDDPFWDRSCPPLHFACRCLLTALTREEADAAGVDDAPETDHADEGFGARPDQGEDWAPDPSSYPEPIADELTVKLGR